MAGKGSYARCIDALNAVDEHVLNLDDVSKKQVYGLLYGLWTQLHKDVYNEEEASAKIHRLDLELTAAKAEIERLRGEVEREKASYERCRVEKYQWVESCNKLAGESEQRRVDLALSRAGFDKANALAIDAIADATEKGKQVRGLQVKLDAANEYTVRLTANYNHVNQEYANLHRENARLKESDTGYRAKIEGLHREKDGLRVEINQLKAELAELIQANGTIANRNYELSEANKAFHAENARLKKLEDLHSRAAASALKASTDKANIRAILLNMPRYTALCRLSAPDNWELWDYPTGENEKRMLLSEVSLSAVLDYLKANPDPAISNNSPTFFNAGHASISGFEDPKRCLSSVVYGVPRRNGDDT